MCVRARVRVYVGVRVCVCVWVVLCQNNNERDHSKNAFHIVFFEITTRENSFKINLK